MASSTHHEELYRGRQVIARLSKAAISLCGAGALGSNLAVNLARTGCTNLTVIDRDRIEEHNIGTQVYGFDDIGARKADILRNMLSYDLRIDVRSVAQELNERNAPKFLRGAELVVDTFDNAASRRVVAEYCRENGIACLHAGVNGEYGEVVWDESYRVPSDQGEDICDYPLARNLILMVVAVASESIFAFLASGERRSYSMTLADLSINREADR